MKKPTKTTKKRRIKPKKNYLGNFSFPKQKEALFLIPAIIILLIFFLATPLLKNFIQTVRAADLSAIVASSGADINLIPGSYTFTGDLTIPAGKTLHYERGAIITIATGQTLNIAGGMDDHLYQIFDDKNTDLAKSVKFANGNILNVRPEWWGATSYCAGTVCPWNAAGVAIATASSNAIEKAVHSHSNNVTNVIFANGTYEITKTIKLVGSVSLKGQKPSTTNIVLMPAAQKNMVEDESALNGGSISDISFSMHGQGSSPPTLQIIYFSHGTSNFTIRDCRFEPNVTPGGYEIFIDGGNNITVENNFLRGSAVYHSMADSHVIYNENAGGETILDNCSGTEARGNISFNDPGAGSGRTALIIKNSHDISVSANRWGPYDYCIKIQNSKNVTVKNNVIYLAWVHGIHTSGTVENVIIQDNSITNSGLISGAASDSDGIYTEGIFNGGSIENNRISGWKKGSLNFDAQPAAGIDYPSIQNNMGIDNADSSQILESVAAPSVEKSSRWKTGNTSPTTITDFTQAPKGKEIFVEFGDSNTTFNFSGNVHLFGNGGADWKPSPGDHMWCQKMDSSWSCNCFDNTP